MNGILEKEETKTGPCRLNVGTDEGQHSNGDSNSENELKELISEEAFFRLKESGTGLHLKSVDELIQMAYGYYNETALPKLVTDFGSLELSPVDGRTLTDLIHLRGLQMRSLGRVTAASYHAIAIGLSLMEAYSFSVQHEQTTLKILQAKLGPEDLRAQDAAAWLEYFESKALEQQEAARNGTPKPDASIASKGHLRLLYRTNLMKLSDNQNGVVKFRLAPGHLSNLLFIQFHKQQELHQVLQINNKAPQGHQNEMVEDAMFHERLENAMYLASGNKEVKVNMVQYEKSEKDNVVIYRPTVAVEVVEETASDEGWLEANTKGRLGNAAGRKSGRRRPALAKLNINGYEYSNI
ncbi:hypothetical protein GH714_034139 [Hevea brasiliensis]|uniref:CLU central domain-containing protein n=1 Tax=Hevea brasiliensis TaxID=3981 RepID=A0A6A6NDX7_HEVBR|nr:hypothetical protein GH714_034139 [Hevea brasiliensis]